jgi:hypothetical protein
MKYLFLAYEIEDYLLSEISSNIHNKSIVGVFYCDTWRWTDKFHFQYTKILSKKFSFSGDLFDEYVRIQNIKKFNEVKIDYDFLTKIESDFCISLEYLIASDPILYDLTHNRNYYNKIEKNLKLFWLEIVLKKIINFLDLHQIDIIFTIGNNYLVKNLFNALSKLRNIKFITLGSARLDNHYIFSDNFLLSINKDFFENDFESNSSNLYKEVYKKTVLEYDSPYNSHKNFKQLNGIDLIKNHIFSYKSLLLQFRNKIKYRGFYRPNLIDNKYFLSIYYEFIVTFRSLILQNIRYSKSIAGEKYVYFPLHVTPESTILTMGMGLDEYECIRNLCLRLPIGINLKVKENPKMMGLRPFNFYRKLLRIDNLKLVDPMESQQELISNSIAVFSIAGTSILEGLLFSKPTYCYGNTEYTGLAGITKIYYSNEPLILNDNIKKSDIIKYCNYIEKVGVKLDLPFLLYAPYQNPNYSKIKYNNGINIITAGLLNHYENTCNK